MSRKIEREYIKEIVADRLMATDQTCSVETEVEIREGGRFLARADIAIFKFSVAPKTTSEITVIEVRISETQVDVGAFEKMRICRAYAHRVFLCLPKGECSAKLAISCEQQGIGLLAVNAVEADGPIGVLSKRVESPVNQKPKKWIDLYLRLEKHGLPIHIFE